MPLVFICNQGAGYLDYPHAPGATEVDFTLQQPLCGSGQGQWMEVSALGVQPPEQAQQQGVSPEQALVQVAIIGTGMLSAFKGLAVGMMR